MSDADVIRADFSRLSHTSDAWEAQLLSSPPTRPRPAATRPGAFGVGGNDDDDD